MSSLFVIILDNVGLASSPRVIAALPFLKSDIVISLSVSFWANSIAVLNLSNKLVSSSGIVKNGLTDLA
jgi:hypothetical protein